MPLDDGQRNLYARKRIENEKLVGWEDDGMVIPVWRGI